MRHTHNALACRSQAADLNYPPEVGGSISEQTMLSKREVNVLHAAAVVVAPRTSIVAHAPRTRKFHHSRHQLPPTTPHEICFRRR